MATATTPKPSGRRSSWSWATTATPRGTATTTRPRSRSSRCSPGRSSWPRSRSSRRAGAASPSPKPHPCSIGRSAWSRSGRRSWSARGARPQDTGGGHPGSVSSPCQSMYAAFFVARNLCTTFLGRFAAKNYKTLCYWPHPLDSMPVDGLAGIPSLRVTSVARLYPLPPRVLSATTNFAPEARIYSRVPKKSA